MCVEKSIHTKNNSHVVITINHYNHAPTVYIYQQILCQSIQNLKFRWSDHDIVVSTITISNTPPPCPGIWKLYTSLLDDKNYVDIIHRFLVQWRDEKQSFDNLSTW